MIPIFGKGELHLKLMSVNALVVGLSYKILGLLPEPTPENIGDSHNGKIAIELRDEFLKHAKGRTPTLKAIIDYGIIKYVQDSYYRGCVDWLLKHWLMTDWRLPDHDMPSKEVWKAIPESTESKIRASIDTNYNLLQDRIKRASETLNGDELNKVIISRKEQFKNRILNDIEREVLSWK